MQIIAPPTAVRAEAVRGDTVICNGVPDRGAGQLRLPLPAKITVKAYDAGGTVVAEHAFADNEGLIIDPYEPEIRNW